MDSFYAGTGIGFPPIHSQQLIKQQVAMEAFRIKFKKIDFNYQLFLFFQNGALYKVTSAPHGMHAYDFIFRVKVN